MNNEDSEREDRIAGNGARILEAQYKCNHWFHKLTTNVANSVCQIQN